MYTFMKCDSQNVLCSAIFDSVLSPHLSSAGVAAGVVLLNVWKTNTEVI